MARKIARSTGKSNSMVEVSSSQGEESQASSNLDLVFSALSSPVRRAILDRLSRGRFSVTELAEPFDISLPAISKHLSILEQAQLIAKEKEGRTYRCHLQLSALVKAAEWVNFYKGLWERQLDEFSRYLEATEKTK